MWVLAARQVAYPPGARRAVLRNLERGGVEQADLAVRRVGPDRGDILRVKSGASLVK